jgi:xeroderma pigmentosum group C-complementing protein
MTYVMAVEEDGYMRDVTPRYAKQYSAKVSKVQSGGRGRREWWDQVVQTLTRPYKLVRDLDVIRFLSQSDIVEAPRRR